MSDSLEGNAFYVLGLGPGCHPVEVERAASKLTGMIALKLKAAGVYTTPLGTRPRDESTIRQAAGRLSDPNERLIQEVWATAPPVDQARVQEETEAMSARPKATWWRCGE